MNSEVLYHGRPFGGCSVLFNSALSHCIDFIDLNCKRLCSIKLRTPSYELYVFNVYLPCDTNNENDSYEYNVPTHKTDRLQRLQNQCARILTKSPRREHITPVLKSLHWLKIQDRITYKILMLTYKSYYNIALTYLCELISRRESSVNTRLGAYHHQLIMPPISKDCSNTFLERSLPLHANGTN